MFLGATSSRKAHTSDGAPIWMSQGYSSDHPAIDLQVPVGTPVYAPHHGTVITSGQYGEAGTGKDCGLTCRIEQPTLRSALCHLSQLVVSEGETVRKGQLIGYSGATGHVTGPHVHWQLAVHGRLMNPIEAVRAAHLQGVALGAAGIAGAGLLLYTFLN
jgi:murein DD-endopeptidase MepM/ murein hydrolase activator NlpD